MAPFWVLLLAWLSQAVTAEPTPEPIKLVRTVALQTKTAHVQGIDTDGTHLWVTSVDRAARKGFLQQFAVSDGRLERSVEVQDGNRYHPGGMAADADSLWIPVAEYRATSTAVIQKRNKRTMALEFQFAVPDHIGCIAVTPDSLIGGNWDSRDFYVWDRQGILKRKVATVGDNSYQDLKFRDGHLIASGLLSGRKSAVDWLDGSTLALVRRLRLGDTDRAVPLTREGMTWFAGGLWLLPEDGNSRLFVFQLPPVNP